MGNVVTDVATGNIPSFNSFGDVLSYTGETAINAYSVAGSSQAFGALARQGLNKLAIQGAKELGEEVLTEGAFSLLSDAEVAEMTLQWYGETVGTGVKIEITDKALNFGIRDVANFGLGAVNTSLGAYHKHHSYPKYLGGDPKQQTTRMLDSDHKQLHRDMNDFMRQQTDAQGNHMRPQRGNSGKDIRRNFKTHEIEGALDRFYKGPGAKYKNAAKHFFKQVSKIR